MPSVSASVSTSDGPCAVELFVPAGDGPWPGVLMWVDAGGVRAAMGEAAARLAELGYAVLLPDVYFRHGDWAPFDLATAFSDGPERERIFAMMSSLTPDRIAADARAHLAWLAERPEVRGDRFATIGYCMGGRCALIAAGRVPELVAVALSFHGGHLVTDDAASPHLLAADMRAAVYVAGATDDDAFTADDAETLTAALRDAGVEHTVEIYPARHGFAVTDNPTFDAAAADRHWEATRRELAAHLP